MDKLFQVPYEENLLSNTTFVNQSTIIVADWLNDVNDVVYSVLGNGTTVPANASAARTNLDVPQTNGTGATGTWPISITGSAVSATTATSATTAVNVSGTVAIANGGTGQTTALAAFNALKQNATDTVTGVVELATDAEAQTGTSTSVVLTPANMKASQIILGTPVTLTTQTSVDFTAIPSYVKKISVTMNGLSLSGTASPLIQLGSTTVQTTGYSASSSNLAAASLATTNSTAGFIINSAFAGNTLSGVLFLQRHTGNIWVCSGSVTSGGTNLFTSAGSVTLSGTLDRVRITTTNGTDQLDAGTVNISWE